MRAAVPVVCVLGFHSALAQTPATSPPAWSARAVVESAWLHYPSVLEARAAAAQAEAAVQATAISNGPVVGVAGQFDRATDNATLGLSFASPLPSISGTVPASDYRLGASTFTSATGAYFAWEVADFGRRSDELHFTQSLARAAGERTELTRLQVGAHAADLFLSLLAAQERERVAGADVARWQTMAHIIHTLVEQQLRPGADGSRVDAELAAARIRQAEAERDRAGLQAALVEATGSGAPAPELVAPPPAPRSEPAAAGTVVHPEIAAQQATIAASRFHISAVEKGALPRTFVQASFYGRGSGVLAAGKFGTGWSGLGPDTAGNWAVGAGFDFSFTRMRVVRAQTAAARADLAQQQARLVRISGALTASQAQAEADLRAAETIADQAPIELTAARAGESQARVRYQAGLSGVVDLANAEQLLAQAEADAALAGLKLWRSRLEMAFARGDLTPWLDEAGH